MPAGRVERHRIETDVDDLTYVILVRVGFEFAPRIREFLDGQARLQMDALGITDYRQNIRKNEPKKP